MALAYPGDKNEDIINNESNILDVHAFEVEEKFGEQNFRVFSEMRWKFWYYNPKN